MSGETGRLCRWATAASLSALALTTIACGEGDDGDEDADAERRPPLGAMALAFDGAAHYATSGTAAFPFAANPQTISLWAHPEGTAAQQALVVLRRDFESGVVVGLRDGELEAWSAYHGRTFARSTEPLTPGWHHLAYVWTGAEHRVYLDGAQVGAGSDEPQNRTPTSCFIGSMDGSRDLYAGRLDELRIWSVARSEEQIALEAAGTIADDLSTLVAYFAFDELSGLRAFDGSGLGNHASLGDGVPERAPARVASEIETP